MPKKYLTAKELAELLSKNKYTIYRWAQQGKIPSCRFEGSLYFDREEIESLIKRGKGKNSQSISHIGIDSCL